MVLEAFLVLAEPTALLLTRRDCFPLHPPHALLCLVTLGVVDALRLVNHPLLANAGGQTPEDVRENSLVNRSRYPGEAAQRRDCRFPASGPSGRASTAAGRTGQLLRDAYDFAITDDEGHSCREPGSRLQDYYCYAMPVLSPVRGQVARVVDELPDNHVGNVDSRRRFGNLVILYDPRGFYVELAHFQPLIPSA